MIVQGQGHVLGTIPGDNGAVAVIDCGPQGGNGVNDCEEAPVTKTVTYVAAPDNGWKFKEWAPGNPPWCKCSHGADKTNPTCSIDPANHRLYDRTEEISGCKAIFE